MTDSRPPFPRRPVTPRQPLPAVRNRQEERMVEAIDELSLFQEYRATLLPAMKKLIDGKAPSSEILKLVEAVAAARLASEAALSDEFNLAAVKELMDRVHGKSTEKKELTHKMAKAKDEELDALLLTAAADADDDEAE